MHFFRVPKARKVKMVLLVTLERMETKVIKEIPDTLELMEEK